MDYIEMVDRGINFNPENSIIRFVAVTFLYHLCIKLCKYREIIEIL